MCFSCPTIFYCLSVCLSVCLAPSLSHFLVFACHILWAEFDLSSSRNNNSNSSRNKPKTFVHVLTESGLSLHIAVFYLVEVGVSSDVPLDFRSHFLSTWLGLTVLGAFPVSLGARMWVSILQVKDTSLL